MQPFPFPYLRQMNRAAEDAFMLHGGAIFEQT